MSDRSDPCKFQLREIEPSTTTVNNDGVEVRKVKKIVPVLDADGNQMFEEKSVVIKKGCGCKGKKKTEETVIKKVLITKEIWVEESVITSENVTECMVVCKLYGKVKKTFCQTCSTYKIRKIR